MTIPLGSKWRLKQAVLDNLDQLPEAKNYDVEILIVDTKVKYNHKGKERFYYWNFKKSINPIDKETLEVYYEKVEENCIVPVEVNGFRIGDSVFVFTRHYDVKTITELYAFETLSNGINREEEDFKEIKQ
jgi:hypothetical protein